MKREVLAWLGVWTAVAALQGLQDIARLSYTHQHIELAHILGERLLQWYSVGAVTPLYIWLVRELQRRVLPRLVTIVLYAAAILGGFIVEGLIYIPLENQVLHGTASFMLGFAYQAFTYSFGNAAIFAAIIAVEHYRVARESETHAATLESELVQARLETLRAQLDPHFLLNTLNGIAALVRHQPDAAEEMIARLGELLRAALQSSSAQEIPLRAELELVDAYLSIMRIRFASRLSVEVSAPFILMNERVPNFFLQPLIENSIRHGMVEAQNLHVRIEIQVINDALLVTVEDDGAGFPPSTVREGIGLSNIRRRLEHLYGSAASLCVDNAEPHGACVSIAFPCRPEALDRGLFKHAG